MTWPGPTAGVRWRSPRCSTWATSAVTSSTPWPCVEPPTAGAWSPLMREALALALAGSYTTQIGRAYANLQTCLVDHLSYVAAEVCYREGVAYCEEHDLGAIALGLAGGHAGVLAHTGRWAEAEAMVE